MKIFTFGNRNRLKPYIKDIDKIESLSYQSLIRLCSRDVIISSRPRSTLLEYLFIKTKPESRPWIIATADGYIFESNCKKKSNLRYGWLYKSIIADLFLINQPIKTINNICTEPEKITSFSEYKSIKTKKKINQPKIILTTGNDPYLGTKKATATQNFRRSIDAIMLRFPQSKNIFISSPNREFQKKISKTHKFIQAIGRIDQSNIDDSDGIFVGTPSTVLYDKFLAGRPTYLIPGYRINDFQGICTEFAKLVTPSKASDEIEYLTPNSIRKKPQISVDEITNYLVKKSAPNQKLGFFKEAQIHVLLNELRLLIRQSKTTTQLTT